MRQQEVMSEYRKRKEKIHEENNHKLEAARKEYSLAVVKITSTYEAKCADLKEKYHMEMDRVKEHNLIIAPKVETALKAKVGQLGSPVH